MSSNHRNVLDAIAETTVGASLELFEVALGGSSHAGSSHGSSHGTDNSSSHGSSHASGSHQLFGSLESLDSGKWTLSLIIVVCSVLFIEAIFHIVHVFTEDTPFHKVILALEKELMIVGVTAFMFKIILTSIADIDEMWKFSLEIAGKIQNVLVGRVSFFTKSFVADLIIPLFSFTNCFISLILIFRSLHHCDIWSKAYHLKAAELLDEYVSSPFRL